MFGESQAHPRDPGLAGQLDALVAVIETGSFSEAARQLGLNNASAARKRVSELARRLSGGRPAPPELVIFDQRSRRVLPTDAGRAAYEYAQHVLGGLYTLITRLNEGDDPRSVIRVGAFPAHVTNCLAGAAREVTTRFPATTFSWNVSDRHRAMPNDLLAGLLSDDLDVVVVPERPRQSKGLLVQELYSWRLVAFGRSLPATISLDDLLQLDLGVSPSGHLSRAILDNAAGGARRKKLDDAVKVECESTTALIALAECGFITAVLPSDALHAGSASSSLQLGGSTHGGTYWLVARSYENVAFNAFLKRCVQRAPN